jgi:molybdate transport system substrate-binding protein
MLSKRKWIGCLGCGAVLFLLPVLARAGEVTVFAAASLTNVLQEIGKAYEAGRPGEKVVFNFGGSNALVQQIEAGAPADLFLSADETKMDELQKKDLLLKGSRKDLLSNSLVVIVEKAGGLDIPGLDALAGSKVHKLSLADTNGVPCGIYAKKYFEKKGVWDKLKDRVVSALNVRAALAAVESGDADAGVVFKTDAAISTKVKVAYEVPAGDVPPIAFPAAVLKDSKSTDEAKDFLAYLESKDGLAVFKKYGFVTLITP